MFNRKRISYTPVSPKSTISVFSMTIACLCSYLIVDNVVYLTIAEKSYPRKLAFSYLDELSKEFANSYGSKVDAVRKPYAFVGFGTLRYCIAARGQMVEKWLQIHSCQKLRDCTKIHGLPQPQPIRQNQTWIG